MRRLVLAAVAFCVLGTASSGWIMSGAWPPQPAILNQIVDNSYADADIVNYFAAHPQTVAVQQLAGYDLTDARWGTLQTKFASIRTAAGATATQLCTDARPDVYRRSGGTPETFGGKTWSDSWILTTALSTHNAQLAVWTGGTKCSGAAGWNTTWFNGLLGGGDFCANTSTPTADPIPILYGDGDDTCASPNTSNAGCTDKWNTQGFVAVDLRNTDWRTFSENRVVAQLHALSNNPGGNPTWVPDCIFVAPKPGWWARWSTWPGGNCWRSGALSWFDSAWPGNAGGSDCRTGPLDPTPYAAGEYELALNSWVRELRTLLRATGPPYSNTRIVFQNAPAGNRGVWWWMDTDNRISGFILGEESGQVAP